MVKKSDDKAFYIYEHPKHINYSSSTFTKLVQLCQSDDIREDTHILGSFLEKTCHASYFPYFYGNDQCASMLDNLVTQGLFTTAQRVSLLDELATKHESVIRRYTVLLLLVKCLQDVMIKATGLKDCMSVYFSMK